MSRRENKGRSTQTELHGREGPPYVRVVEPPPELAVSRPVKLEAQSVRSVVREGFPSLSKEQFRLLCYTLCGIGFLTRLVLWQISEGSNDVRLWFQFAHEISHDGLAATYVHNGLFNHPPTMGLLAATSLRLSEALNVSFAKVFKTWPIAAEFGTAYLLFSLWRRRGEMDRAALALAAYGCSLICILLSGFHGNLDPVYWFFVLATCYWLETRDAPFRAGLLLGAALDVKLIPLLVVLPLSATCRDLRSFVRFGTGMCLALVPFALPLVWFTGEERHAFVRNIFGYSSWTDNWGIEMVQRVLVGVFHDSAPQIATWASDFGAYYHRAGAKLLLSMTTLIAGWQLLSVRKLDAYSMAAVCFCLFLVMASGFGVQYLGCAVPVLMAVHVAAGFRAATATGVFAALMYCTFITSWSPIITVHRDSPNFLAPASFMAWWVLLGCLIQMGRRFIWPDFRRAWLPGEPRRADEQSH